MYDAIVVGVGVMGASALYHLAARGRRVLGIERFQPGHSLGSSHGHSRVIRRAYFEHPNYVPLIHEAYGQWRALERESGQSLMTLCGMLVAAPADDEVITGTLRSAELHRLELRQLSAREANREYKGFRFQEDMAVLFDPMGGFLRAEACVHALYEQALRRDAEVHGNETVKGWESDGRTVTVDTDKGRYWAGSLVVCAGAWSGRILASLGLPLEVQRTVLTWWDPRDDSYRVSNNSPAFGVVMDGAPRRFFYGVPQFDGRGVKVAEHAGTQVVGDPSELRRTVDYRAEFEDLKGFVRRHMPSLSGGPRHASVCMYTYSPDRHFILDTSPEHPNVHFAAGFSGHGFKFAPVIGFILADFCETGTTRHPIEFLRLSRFGRRIS